MDSISPDLRDALDEVLARAAAGEGGSTTNASSSSSAKKKDNSCCFKCEKGAPDVDRLRWCGGCHAVRYCNKTCARADWAAYKLTCKKLGEMRDKSVADWEASGSEKKSYNQQDRDASSWYDGVPGFSERSRAFGVEARRCRDHLTDL